jgi:hypothetical protein
VLNASSYLVSWASCRVGVILYRQGEKLNSHNLLNRLKYEI